MGAKSILTRSVSATFQKGNPRMKTGFIRGLPFSRGKVAFSLTAALNQLAHRLCVVFHQMLRASIQIRDRRLVHIDA